MTPCLSTERHKHLNPEHLLAAYQGADNICDPEHLLAAYQGADNILSGDIPLLSVLYAPAVFMSIKPDKIPLSFLDRTEIFLWQGAEIGIPG